MVIVMQIVYGQKKGQWTNLEIVKDFLKKSRDLGEKLRNFVKFDFRKNRHETQNIRMLIVFFDRSNINLL